MLPGVSAQWEQRDVAGVGVPLIPHGCSQCGYPFRWKHKLTNGRCYNCNQSQRRLQFHPSGLSYAWAMTTYLTAPQFGNHPGTLLVEGAKTSPGMTQAIMGATAQQFQTANRWPDWKPTAIVPCPSTSAPSFPRALLMGQAVSKVLGVQCQDILVKSPGAMKRSSQTAKAYPSTFAELSQQGYSTCVGRLMGHDNVLLVDDLMTQGATAASSALALRQAGAGDVRLITFAQYTTSIHLEQYCD